MEIIKNGKVAYYSDNAIEVTSSPRSSKYPTTLTGKILLSHQYSFNNIFLINSTGNQGHHASGEEK